ncbi:lipopolysaccharide cholinephosphotransferase licd [Plakobranchus ocellatus]|uniref:Lipopolysaccharide cholinephosphotransferase licd n=1 Tax=Plakobranchus ocellatus TaxID=259542 RepID=A0AAV4BDE7_9GAST|nr:lipopolysaccharide cholinephosphotransferase licd [Plakobranchus ocellatus]
MLKPKEKAMGLHFLRPTTRSKWNPTGFSLRVRVCQRLLVVVGLFLLVAILLMVHIPSRNTLLQNVWPRMWVDVDTRKILKMHTELGNINVGSCADVKCPGGWYRPRAKREDVERRRILFYDTEELNSRAEDLEQWMWKFLPLMDKQEKITLLHTLDVLAEVMAFAGLDFFLVDGTLLGVVRHHGIIPWDDDIDVAVNGSQWQQVKQALCCVEGFKLIPKSFMHWKFFYLNGSIIRNWPMYRFPFVDLFFFTEDEEYLWALTSYNLQNLVIKKSDVFPLSRAMLDGQMYPVPWSANTLVRHQFGELDRCVSPSHMHKYDHSIHGSGKITVPCSQLDHLYPMFQKLDRGGRRTNLGNKNSEKRKKNLR